jgi:Bifunctional DNA primase/polymerase, N-terminal/Primase C terminal 2 (PriCT-2)
MTTLPSAEAVDPQLIKAVSNFRLGALANGYKPVRVRSMSKSPVAKQWQYGEAENQLRAVEATALNTGILTAGLRCIDVDVDNHQIAAAIKTKILALCPGALIRVRAGSSRFAAVVRAADGEPGKRSVAGQHGKLEILGAGQQFVAHGVHPTGAIYEWEGGRGPDTVPVDQLPAATEDDIGELLECAPLLGTSTVGGGIGELSNVFEQPSSAVSVYNNRAPVENELGAGIKTPEWFDYLSEGEKTTLTRACLNAIDNTKSDPRDLWLRVLYALFDAGERGCPDAEQLAREWSRRGCGWTGDGDFDTTWRSLKPGALT